MNNDLREAITDLLSVMDYGDEDPDFADDEAVSYRTDQDGNPIDDPMTFGHIRRVRAALASLPQDDGLRERIAETVKAGMVISSEYKICGNGPRYFVSNGLEVADAIIALLPDGAGWRPEVRAFADLMEAKLRENDHKGSWKSENPHDLWPRIREEANELYDLLEFVTDGQTSGYLGDPDEIGREAADVANFAMMIADVCGALPTPPEASGEG